jgi:predicted CXXCH cytochrome family protein
MAKRGARFLHVVVGVLGPVFTLSAASAFGQDPDGCLECHAVPELETALPSGEPLGVTLDPSRWEASVHAAAGISCTLCHVEHSEYPHAPLPDASRRHYAVRSSEACAGCHPDQAERVVDSVHQDALAAGNMEAAACSDCHDPHTQGRINDPETGTILASARLAIPLTCSRCHTAIFGEYRSSAHGAALLNGASLDVPTCIDCHGVHDIEDPTSVRFRLKSPEVCAGCHTDPARMARYGLSTRVWRTYVADFHGTTVTLFQRQHPDQPTNMPVCYDCHGYHDVRHKDDPEKGLHVRENLLRTCQRCHPDATANFPDAWLSHYIPDRERTPLVYWVGTLYKVLIPATVGGMLAFVSLDYARRRIDRARRRRAGAAQDGGSEAKP